MSQHEQLHERLKTCGGFETSLIHAWFNADSSNKARLEQAFKNTPFDLTYNSEDLKPLHSPGIDTNLCLATKNVYRFKKPKNS